MKGFVIIALLLVSALPQADDRVLASQPGAPQYVQGIPAEGITETQLAKALAQGGAIGLLTLVLFFYRRDFFRQKEELERELRAAHEEKEQLVAVLKESTAAITASAVATARQTDATYNLARTVEKMEKRT